MKILRNSLLAFALCLVGTAPSWGQFNNVGTSAANFLKIQVGARGAAMGGAFSAIVDDASSLYWNPAGMAAMTSNEVTFSQNYWLLDLRQDFVAGAFRVGDYNRIGVSVSYLSMGDMKQTSPSQPRGTGLEFSAYDVAIGLGFARQLTDRIAAGLQAKMIRQTIAETSAQGLGFDLGLQYRSSWNNLRIGATITNFGTNMSMNGDDLRVNLDPYLNTGNNPDDVPVELATEAWQLPMQFQFGVAITPVQNETFSFTPVLDVRKPRDLNQQLRLGAELGVFDALFLRGGVSAFSIKGDFFGNDDVLVEGQEGGSNPIVGGGFVNPTTIDREDLNDGQALFNLGAGLNYMLPNNGLGVKFDYAFSAVQTLDDVHRFGLSVAF